MLKLNRYLKIAILSTLVLALGLAFLPAATASAATLDQPAAAGAPRLEQGWARAQAVYQRQGERLAKADTFIAKVQSLIDKVTQKGLDASAVQAALDAFKAVIPAAQAAHAQGAAIIASHNGFDGSGVVTDRAAAIETLKSLTQVLKDTRSAMNGTGKALHEAVKAFREANKPTK